MEVGIAAAQVPGPEVLQPDLASCSGGSATAAASPEMGFWLSQRRGANISNTRPDRDLFFAAREAGFDFVRLSADKWAGAAGAFLIGPVDGYAGLVESDVAVLLQALDWAEEAGLPVVLTMYRLPGAPALPLDGMDGEQRLWLRVDQWRRAIGFWHDLAAAIGSHPALVGYSLLNDPRPERAMGYDSPLGPELAEAAALARGTTADINALYRCLTDAIRSADATTPILVEPGKAASADAIPYLEPLADPAVLYSIDDFFPYIFTLPVGTTARFAYPGSMDVEGELKWVDRRAIEDHLAPLSDWAARHRIPPQRIIVAEFGVDRLAVGAPAYVNDTVAVLNTAGWHWAVYSYREDLWHTMDYELGANVLGELPSDLDQRGEALDAIRTRSNEFVDLWAQFTK